LWGSCPLRRFSVHVRTTGGRCLPCARCCQGGNATNDTFSVPRGDDQEEFYFCCLCAQLSSERCPQQHPGGSVTTHVIVKTQTIENSKSTATHKGGKDQPNHNPQPRAGGGTCTQTRQSIFNSVFSVSYAANCRLVPGMARVVLVAHPL
jgi:hypothetical protein